MLGVIVGIALLVLFFHARLQRWPMEHRAWILVAGAFYAAILAVELDIHAIRDLQILGVLGCWLGFLALDAFYFLPIGMFWILGSWCAGVSLAFIAPAVRPRRPQANRWHQAPPPAAAVLPLLPSPPLPRLSLLPAPILACQQGLSHP